ncbi:MAG: DUF3801 domain-containing protein [Lachnospiraceae bacterium]|nr:DUF3801 domain-containing protein [Lachnospiraceae bacterium]
MSMESESAEQVVSMGLKGVEAGASLAGKAAVGTSKVILALFLAAARKVAEGKKLTPGEKRLYQFLKDGDPIHIFTVNKDDLVLVKDAMKEYGIAYTVIHDKYGDGTIDILTREKDAARAARALERYQIDAIQKVLDDREDLDKVLEDANFTNGKNYTFTEILEDCCGSLAEGQEVYICHPDHPDNYIRAVTQEAVYDDRTCYETEFAVHRDGEPQRCEHFKHGRFLRRTDAAGNNTSGKGDEHWAALQEEMQEKTGIRNLVKVFTDKESYLQYRQEIMQQVPENSREAVETIAEQVLENPQRAKTESAAPSAQSSSSLRNENKEAAEWTPAEPEAPQTWIQNGRTMGAAEAAERCCGKEMEGQEVYICHPDHPDNYIRAVTQETIYEGRVCYETEFAVYKDGEPQRCEHFMHGHFLRRTDAAGDNTSSKGDEHWVALQEEMQAKTGMRETVKVFADKESYLQYRREIMQQPGNSRAAVEMIADQAPKNPRSAKTASAEQNRSSLLQENRAQSKNVAKAPKAPAREPVKKRLERCDQAAKAELAERLAKQLSIEQVLQQKAQKK